MAKVTGGISSIEREQVDKLNDLNNMGEGKINSAQWAQMSICAVVAHLVECSDKDEVQACLDMIETESQSN